MAINYTNLFTDAGKLLKYLNVYLGYASTSLPSDFSAIAGVISTDGQYSVLSGLPETYNGFQDQAVQWGNSLGNRIQARFLDLNTVLAFLPVGNQASAQQVLLELIKDMITNSQTVKSCSTTVGSPTPAAWNAGDCQVVVTKMLDGVTPPLNNGALSSPQYAGLNSQLAVASETMTLTCTVDSEAGASEGSEQFNWIGGVPGQGAFDWRSEGSGNGPQLQVSNGRGLIQNGEMETFTVTNTPDSWTVVTGTPGTHLLKDASVFKRGLSSLAFKGDGALASIKLKQIPGTLTPRRGYFVGLWIEGDATAAGTSEFKVQFEGTGYSVGATEKIDLNQAALAALTSFGFYSFYIIMPAFIPPDFGLTLNALGTLTNGAKVRVDGICLVEATWHGGVGVGLFAGGSTILEGDRFTFTLANSNAGVFQVFFRKFFKTQLPSSVSPSISDSLAV